MIVTSKILMYMNIYIQVKKGNARKNLFCQYKIESKCKQRSCHLLKVSLYDALIAVSSFHFPSIFRFPLIFWNYNSLLASGYTLPEIAQVAIEVDKVKKQRQESSFKYLSGPFGAVFQKRSRAFFNTLVGNRNNPTSTWAKTA